MFRRGRRIFIGKAGGREISHHHYHFLRHLRSVRPRPPLLPGSIGCGPRPTGDPPDNQSHRSVAPSCARRSRVNRRQLHTARLPPGARRSDARSRANVALLPCRIPRNLCHVEEAILSLVAADDRNGAKMSTKGEAEERVRQ